METKIEKSRQNGKATNGELKDIKGLNGHAVLNTEVKETAKETVSETEKKQEQLKSDNQDKIQEQKALQLTIEEKISKVEDLKIVISKREKLIESRKKLNSFVLGSNQSNENLTITDKNGNSFISSNTEVLTSVVDLIRNIIDEKIKESESQINF